MPVDKTVIKVPKIAFTQLFPNVVSNFNQVTYNEGIYIYNESKKATYPKSVIRIYKNPNNPKKVYFAAKDTSLLENYVLNLINIGATKDDNPESFKSVAPYNEQSYYWSRTETEDSYRDYSLFSQPNNLILNENITEKTLNLYRVPQSSEQIAYLSSLNSDSRINNNFYEYGVFLKAKSVILDNEQYDSYEPNKYLSSINYEIDSGSFENKTLLYEKFLFNDIENVDSITPLFETELELFENATIKSVNKINFSEFIVRKFDNLLVADSNGFLFPDKSESGGETYLQINVDSKMMVLFKKSSTNDSVYYPIYSSIDDEDYVGYKTELPEPSVAQSNDDEEGQLLIDLSINYLDDKKILFVKDNNLVSTTKDYEMVDVKDILNYRFYSYNPGNLLNVKFDGSLNLKKRGFESFGIEKRLNLEYEKDYVKIKPSVDTGVEIESYGDTQLNSTMYVFKDSFNYSKYNFFPVDFNETIYEFELDKELDISNGAFVVAEIK